jgi:lipoprotein-anchoring transpeptidase ErfK/SrfK
MFARGVILAALLVAGCGGSPDAASAPEQPPFTPAEVEAAPAAAPVPEGRYLLARVLAPTELRQAPGGRALARLGTRTEFGSRRVLAVTARRDGWLQVIAPERPNGRRGWIPERRVQLAATDLSVHIDRSARRLTLRRGGRALRRFPVAVGRVGTPTPTGRFAITDKLHPDRADSPYGCCALALSGHQTRLVPGWPGGDRLAIHATPQVETVGTRASLGCVRAYERDIRALMRVVPVGTPVFVTA